MSERHVGGSVEDLPGGLVVGVRGQARVREGRATAGAAVVIVAAVVHGDDPGAGIVGPIATWGEALAPERSARLATLEPPRSSIIAAARQAPAGSKAIWRSGVLPIRVTR